MHFSASTQYALLALTQLDHNPTAAPIPCSHLAKLGTMPDRFLLQVMRSLVNAGLCVSTRGVDGGYRLSRPANKITLLEVVEATDGPMGVSCPHYLSAIWPTAMSRLGHAAWNATKAIRDEYKRVTLADLINPKAERRMTVAARS